MSNTHDTDALKAAVQAKPWLLNGKMIDLAYPVPKEHAEALRDTVNVLMGPRTSYAGAGEGLQVRFAELQGPKDAGRYSVNIFAPGYDIGRMFTQKTGARLFNSLEEIPNEMRPKERTDTMTDGLPPKAGEATESKAVGKPPLSEAKAREIVGAEGWNASQGGTVYSAKSYEEKDALRLVEALETLGVENVAAKDYNHRKSFTIEAPSVSFKETLPEVEVADFRARAEARQRGETAGAGRGGR